MADLHVVILAAGKGKRMCSQEPKVLHSVLYRPMLHYALNLAFAVARKSVSVIVGSSEEKVREACSSFKGIQFFVQRDQKGTAHALSMALPFLKKQGGDVLVLNGDSVLLSSKQIRRLLEHHRKGGNAVTILTAEVSNSSGYGRMVRDSKTGNVVAIREHSDCSEAELKIREINSGVYCFQIGALLSGLKKITANNAQGEYYLTDIVSVSLSEGKKVGAELAQDPAEVLGINDRIALVRSEQLLRQRVNDKHMAGGVTIHDPQTVTIDASTEFGSDCELEGQTVIVNSKIGSGVYIEGNCRIVDSTISSRVRIRQGSYLEGSVVGEGCQLGPYARLRPGSKLTKDVKIGNFVEIKKTTLGEGTKVSHLSYLGDADIGKHVNVGCGFVTCNYDGSAEKKRTKIEDGVFIGSDSQTVAPVSIGKNAYIASGTTVTEDVPAGALALSRGRQVTKPGYVGRRSKRARK